MTETNTKLETKFVDFEIANGILFLIYKEKINLDIAKEVVKTRLKFTKGKGYPLLVSGVNVAFFAKDARDYLSSDEGVKGVSAGAIFVDSVFHAYLGNFFIKVSKPKIPARLFTDKTKALKWLEGHKHSL